MKSRGSHPVHTEICREWKALWPCQYDWERNKILPKGSAAETMGGFKTAFNEALPRQSSTSPMFGLQVVIVVLAARVKPRVIPPNLLLCPWYQWNPFSISLNVAPREQGRPLPCWLKYLSGRFAPH